MPGVIWLASYPKSGNTWLRAFLATYFANPDEPLPINELYKFCYGDGFLYFYELVSGRKGENLTETDIRRLRPMVHKYFGSHPNETKFAKTHNLIGDEGGVPLITPEATAGAIYVLRNPLDVVISLAHHYDVSLDRGVEIMCEKDRVLYGDPAKQVPDFVGNWGQHVESWVDAPGLAPHVMRYEDMLNKPGPTFRKLVKFLGLPIETKRLQKAVKFTSFESLSRQEKIQGFNEARPDGTTRFFRKGQSGQWREQLSEEQVAALIDTNGRAMQRFGYLDKSGRPV